MAGTCRKCKGPTTNTRARSEKGLCFNCEHGLVPYLPFPPNIIEILEETLEERIQKLENRVEHLEMEEKDETNNF